MLDPYGIQDLVSKWSAQGDLINSINQRIAEEKDKSYKEGFTKCIEKVSHQLHNNVDQITQRLLCIRTPLLVDEFKLDDILSGKCTQDIQPGRIFKVGDIADISSYWPVSSNDKTITVKIIYTLDITITSQYFDMGYGDRRYWGSSSLQYIFDLEYPRRDKQYGIHGYYSFLDYIKNKFGKLPTFKEKPYEAQIVRWEKLNEF
jgi:hypothetical protein